MESKATVRRVTTYVMRAAIVTAVVLFVGATLIPVKAFVPPPGLAAAVIQAIPTLVGLLKKKPDPKATTNGNKALEPIQQYAQREQIAWRIVSASGLATQHIAVMRHILDSTKSPDKDNMSDLANDWTFVDESIAAIVQSKPKTSVFDSDSIMVSAINKLLLNGAALRKNIGAQLKYDPDKAATQGQTLANLKKNVGALDEILQALNDSTGSEIEMIADELAVLGTAPASASDGTAAKAAGKKVSQSAFGDPDALDKPVNDLQQQLNNYAATTITVQ